MSLAFGVCLAALSDHGLVSALDVARSFGLSTIDLPVDRRFGFLTGEGGVADLRARCRAAGVSVSAVSESTECRMLLGPYGGLANAGFTGSVAQARSRAEAAARTAIDVAAAVGAPHARLFLGCPDLGRWLTWHGSLANWSDNIKEYVERVVPLIDYAEDYGVRLLVEPHPKQVGYDLESVTALVEACGGRFDVCVDPANLLALGHDPVDFVRSLPVAPAMVQAKDVQRAPATGARHGAGWVRYGPQPAVRFRAAGWGEVDWRGLLSALVDRSYQGSVLVEHEDLLCAPATGIAAAVEYLRPLADVLSCGNERSW